MTAKPAKIGYECVSCGHREAKWLGRCPECGEWNTMRESAAPAADGRAVRARKFSVPLDAVDPAEGSRTSSGLVEVDRVLGGGIMRGSSVLVGGEPGIGKSTLLLQIAALAGVKGRVLYISGEESAAQIRLRADRLGLRREGLEVLCTGDLAEALAALERVKPALFVVDSLQTLSSAEAGAVPGTANQVKYCSLELSDWARERGSACFLVAHVTKDGIIAGPKAAEHTVDVVLMFEQSESDVRFLRSAKNRFGSTDEVGLFTMTERGLAELSDPEAVFLVRREGGAPAGAAIAATWEGTRCILVEIQALTVPGKASLSRVYSERIEPARVARVAAVLEKHAGPAAVRSGHLRQCCRRHPAGRARRRSGAGRRAVLGADRPAAAPGRRAGRRSVAGRRGSAGQADVRQGEGCKGDGSGPRGRSSRDTRGGCRVR